jgi:outer membrane protein TolC
MFSLIRALAFAARPVLTVRLFVGLGALIAAIGVQAQPTTVTLTAAIELALQHSALTKSAQSSILASREMAAKAGQLPDPNLKVGVDNLPVTGPDRLSIDRDFMTMRRIGIEQQWVSSAKRGARAARAEKAVALEESTYLATVARVREETAIAWFNELYAQRALALIIALESEAAQDLDAGKAAFKGAKLAASDVTQSQLALSLAQDRIRKARQVLRSAQIALRRWTMIPVEAVADSVPGLTSHVPDLPLADLEKYHPMLLTAKRAVTLADADTDVAVRDRSSDWTYEASFSQRGSQYSNMVSVGVNIPLTLNRAQRQDRDVAEKLALATRARLQYDDAVRELRAELDEESATLTSLNERVTQLNAALLPPARQQVELALAAYRSGAGPLTAVFNAKKALLEVRMQILDVEKEAGIVWAKLEYHVIPHDSNAMQGAEQ